MNRNLIELNDNYGVSIDEDGNVTMIAKGQNDTSFKEILQKENELESLNDDLELLNKELDIKKFDLKICRIVNVATIFVVSFFGFITYNTTASIDQAILMSVASGAFMKIMPLGASGTTIGNKRKIKRLTNKIYELENEIPKLEKEISDIKEKVNYTTLSDDSSKNDYQELVFDNMRTQNEAKNVSKVKVLKLTKIK